MLSYKLLGRIFKEIADDYLAAYVIGKTDEQIQMVVEDIMTMVRETIENLSVANTSAVLMQQNFITILKVAEIYAEELGKVKEETKPKLLH